MARPKIDKSKSKRKNDQYEYKGTVGRDMNGRPIRKSFYSSVSLAEAKKKHEQYMVEQKAAEITGTVFVPSSTGFTEWGRVWLETYKKPHVDENTYRLTYKSTCEKHLFPYFGDADLRTIRPADVQKFFASKKALSESMLRKINMCLVGIFDSAIENDKCYKNPARSQNVTFSSDRQKNVKKVYSAEQITRVTQLCHLPEVTAILYTGMRRGEVCGLMWSDIDFEQGVYTIQRSVAVKEGGGVKINPPKWNSVRTNPIEKEFDALLKTLGKRSPYVFANQKGAVQNPTILSQNIAHHMDKLPADLPRLTAHELRHTYGTNLRRRGVDIYTIQKIMGHRDIKMTSEVYVHNEVDELKKAIDLADRRGTKKRFKIKKA